MKIPILSICIPTYNNVEKLHRLLDCLMKQYCEEIEIVISDNGDDETDRLVKNYPVKYYRNRVNVGFDRNLIKTLEMATGKYCWTLNDNCIIQGNAINYLLSAVNNNCDVYLISEENKEPIIFNTGNELLKNHKLVGGKLSRVILKKDKILNPEKYIGNLWIHFSLAIDMASRGRICVIKELTIPEDSQSRWAIKDGMGFIAFVNLKRFFLSCKDLNYDSDIISKINSKFIFDSIKSLASAKTYGLKINFDNFLLLFDFPLVFPILFIIFITPTFVLRFIKKIYIYGKKTLRYI